MLDLFERKKWRKDIKQYVLRLGPVLKKRYGFSDQYTVKQVEKTVHGLGMDDQYLAYAIALYRHEESINTIKLYRINQDFLNTLREELSEYIYGYNKNYTAKDIIQLSKPKPWRGGRHENWLANYFGMTGF